MRWLLFMNFLFIGINCILTCLDRHVYEQNLKDSLFFLAHTSVPIKLLRMSKSPSYFQFSSTYGYSFFCLLSCKQKMHLPFCNFYPAIQNMLFIVQWDFCFWSPLLRLCEFLRNCVEANLCLCHMLCLRSLLGNFQVAVHIFVSTMIAVCPTTLNSPFSKLSHSTHMPHRKGQVL